MFPSFFCIELDVVDCVFFISLRSNWFWNKFVSPHSSVSPVKGLYLYGGVGTGKTMLMDLFFHQL